MNPLSILLEIMSEDVTFLVDRAALVLTTVFDWNFLLVTTFLEAAASACGALVTAAAAAGRCLEDLAAFVLDLVAIVVGLLQALEALMMALWWGASSSALWTGQLLAAVGRWLVAGAGGLAGATLLLGRALALLWEALLAALAVIPSSLKSVAGSASGLAVGAGEMLNGGHDALGRTLRKTLTSLRDVPRDACLGLAILVLAWYAVKRFALVRRARIAATRMPALVEKLGSALSAMVKKLVLRAKGLGSFLKAQIGHLVSFLKSLGSLLTRRPSPAEEEDEDENEVGPAVRRQPDRDGSPEEEVVPKRVLRSAAKSADKDKAGRMEDQVVLRLRKQVERLQETNLCVVCQEAGRAITLLPCSHLCLCEPCTGQVLAVKRACPICRRYVENVLRVYT